MKRKKEFFGVLISVLLSVSLVCLAVYATTTIGDDITVGDDLTATGDIITSTTFKDAFGWNTNSKNKALLSLSLNSGGFGSSYPSGTTFNSAANWTVYDATAVDADAKKFISAVFDGRYIYFVPTSDGSSFFNSHVARYDTTADFSTAGSWTVYDVSAVDTNAGGFEGAVFDGRYIYFVPLSDASYNTSGHVTRYDTTADFSTAGSWTVYDVTAVDSEALGFEGAVFDGRYVYFVPNWDSGWDNNGHVTRYDTTADFSTAGSWTVFDVETINSSAEGFIGAVFDGRYVYFVPYMNDDASPWMHGIVTRYDTTADFSTAGSWTVYDVNNVDLDAEGFTGAVFDGRYVYFVPSYSGGGAALNGHVTRYDTTADFSTASSWTVYDLVADIDSNAKGFFGAVFDGRYIYFVPYSTASNVFSGLVTRYDTTKDFSTVGSWTVYDVETGVDTDAEGFFGAVFDGRYVYFVPYKSESGSNGHVTRFDTGSPAPMSGIHQLAKTSQFYINSSGYVGIGTTNPDVEFAVSGTASVSSDLYVHGAAYFNSTVSISANVDLGDSVANDIVTANSVFRVGEIAVGSIPGCTAALDNGLIYVSDSDDCSNGGGDGVLCVCDGDATTWDVVVNN